MKILESPLELANSAWESIFSFFQSLSGLSPLLIPLACLLIIGLIYFLPTIVASSRGHKNTAPILLINLLLGWTLIGWVCALAWAIAHGQELNKRPPLLINVKK